MDGALMEVGPFRLGHSQDKIELNPGSWHKNANLIFIDQPVGTGLSTTDTDSYLHELPEMSSDLITFMEKYFEIFPERQFDEYYIAGESFAGQYIPYFARAILDKNLNKTSPLLTPLEDEPPVVPAKKPTSKPAAKPAPSASSASESSTPSGTSESPAPSSTSHAKRSTTAPWMDLKAVLIGNGWIDPPSQYLTYLPFVYQSGLIEQGSEIAAKIEHQTKECQKYFETHENDRAGLSIRVCDQILDSILRELFLATGLPKSDPNACVNVYDVRLRDTYSSCGMNWPPDLVNVTPFLRQKDVLAALHVPVTRGWKECSGPVGSAFKARHSNPSIKIIPSLIEDQIQVVMFNGDQDLICNHVGNERLIQSLRWGYNDTSEDVNDAVAHLARGSSGFLPDESTRDWYVDGEAAGTIQTGRNLTYIKVYNASHMVPFDVPIVAQAMVNQFLGIPGYSQEEQQPKVEEPKVEEPKVEEKPEEKPEEQTPAEPETENKQIEETTEDEQKTDGEEEEDGTWVPYYKAGAMVLVVVIMVAALLGFFVWRNRRLTREALMSLPSPTRRGVHYEDELDDYETALRQQQQRGGEEGFFSSILSGMSRWHVPVRGGHKRTPSSSILKTGSSGKYQHLNSSSEALVGGDVQLESLKRDSLDSILEDSDDDEPQHSSSRGPENV